MAALGPVRIRPQEGVDAPGSGPSVAMLRHRNNEHLRLLTDVGEHLATLAGSTDITHFLQKTADRLAMHLGGADCSIFLLDEASGELALSATTLPNPGSAGHVRFKLGNGLVGRCMKELIVIRHTSETGADMTGSQAAVALPIHRGVQRIGVLLIGHRAGAVISETEVMVGRALTSQMAGAIESARTLLRIRSGNPEEPAIRKASPPSLVRGRVACPGYAHAPAVMFLRRVAFESADSPEAPGTGTAADLKRALKRTSKEISALQAKLAERLPEVASLIFESHLMMLKDDSFTGRMFQLIDGGLQARPAVLTIAREYANLFQASRHEYLKEKARDVEDLALRIVGHLDPARTDDAPTFARRIVIAAELYPSDVLKLAIEGVAGIILVSGGTTSHVAILARSFAIPTVIVSCPELLGLPNGAVLLMDANIGNVYVSPAPEVTLRYAGRERARVAAAARGATMQDTTKTCDGVAVSLMANINLLSELDLASELKAEGVGLYRTEFPFLVRQTFPTEEEQRVVYGRLLERMQDREVTIRTLDAGGDKMLAFFDIGSEANPELGLRATRFTLKNPEVFDDQIRAILTAMESHSRTRIMFPMIGSLDEFLAARGRVAAAVEHLKESRGLHIRMPPVGMMIEIPSAMETIDDFIGQADFFSVGTNDLVQYMLAADRTNERVAEYYCPHHPAVLRSLKRVVEKVVGAGADLSVCGEMAHDLRYIPFLVGIGVRKLSVDPHHLPDIQQTISRFSISWAEEYAGVLVACKTVAEATEHLREVKLPPED